MPTLTIALFDNSGSVTAPGGTDPLSNRFAEVAHAFALVARAGTRRELGSVLHFDSPCSGDVPPVPVTRRNLPRLQVGLQVPPETAGASVLGPSLVQARHLAAAFPDHVVTLVVLSDFQLFDPDLSQVLAELAAFPGAVHAVVLDSRVPQFAPSIAVSTVSASDPPGAVGRALFASLVAHRPGSLLHPRRG